MRYYKIIDGHDVFFTGNTLYTDTASILNPTEQQLLDAGWLIYEEPIVEPTEEQILESTKLEKIREIDLYDSSDNVNLFFLNGQHMWLDALTRLTLRISIESYIATSQLEVTKWFQGHQFTFSVETWLLMLNTLEVYAAEALNVTEQHKADILALDNIEDVNNYDITIGYPEKLNFSLQ